MSLANSLHNRLKESTKDFFNATVTTWAAWVWATIASAKTALTSALATATWFLGITTAIVGVSTVTVGALKSLFNSNSKIT